MHEMTWPRYWWSIKCANPTTYRRAYKYMQDFMIVNLGLDNILFTWAAAKVSWYENATFNQWYPGDDCVDILGFDRYASYETYGEDLLADCQTAVIHGIDVGKVVVAAETGVSKGIQGVPETDFFMKSFLLPMANDPLCKQIAYALTWANFNEEKYWIPLKGQPNYDSFVEMYQSNKSVFSEDPRWVDIQMRYGLGVYSSYDGPFPV